MNWGKKIKEWLTVKGLDQKELADKMGVHEQTVSRWVNSTHLKTNTIEELCKALDISLIDFCFGQEEISNYLDISNDVLAIAMRVDKLPDQYKLMFLKHMMTGLELIDARARGVQ